MLLLGNAFTEALSARSLMLVPRTEEAAGYRQGRGKFPKRKGEA